MKSYKIKKRSERFIPYIANECWEKITKQNNLSSQVWPEVENTILKKDRFDVVIQINGKKRAIINAINNENEDSIFSKSLAIKNIKVILENKNIIIEEILNSRQKLFLFSLKLLKNNKQSAEDLTQDTIQKAISNIDSLKNTDNIGGWLYTIARNIFINNSCCSIIQIRACCSDWQPNIAIAISIHYLIFSK